MPVYKREQKITLREKFKLEIYRFLYTGASFSCSMEEKVEKKKNKWFEHLANVRSENPGLTYKEQRKIAQESYKKTG